eukprot:SAG11_NODE_1509_length_4774_cov_5.905668_1_plen_353_part_00
MRTVRPSAPVPCRLAAKIRAVRMGGGSQLQARLSSPPLNPTRGAAALKERLPLSTRLSRSCTGCFCNAKHRSGARSPRVNVNGSIRQLCTAAPHVTLAAKEAWGSAVHKGPLRPPSTLANGSSKTLAEAMGECNCLPATLVACEVLSPSVKSFLFRLDAREIERLSFSFEAGQAVEVFAEHAGDGVGSLLQGSGTYSIASTPGQLRAKAELLLVVKSSTRHALSRWLHNVAVSSCAATRMPASTDASPCSRYASLYPSHGASPPRTLTLRLWCTVGDAAAACRRRSAAKACVQLLASLELAAGERRGAAAAAGGWAGNQSALCDSEARSRMGELWRAPVPTNLAPLLRTDGR